MTTSDTLPWTMYCWC